MTLSVAETVAQRCAACAHVEVAFLSCDERLVIVQAVIDARSRAHEGSTLFEPVYPPPVIVRELSTVVSSITSKCPGVDAWLVGYVIRPGDSFRIVYLKSETYRRGRGKPAGPVQAQPPAPARRAASGGRR